MIYEFVYVTIHYTCGHDGLRAMLIGLVGRRERWSYERCQHCSEMREQRYKTVRQWEAEQVEEVGA